MKYKIVLIVVSALLLANHSYGQQAWTLRECIDYAIEHNLNIQQSENAVNQSEIEKNTAKWARLPNLNGSASQQFGWGREKSPKTNTYVDNLNTANTSFSLNTNVPLFTGFELPNQYALSKLNLKAAIEDLNKAKDDIAINVASYYVQTLYTKELSKVAKEQVLLSNEQLNRATRLAELGKASPAEVAEAKARVAQDEMSAVQAENDYHLAVLELTQLLELPTPDGFAVADPNIEPDFITLSPPDDIYLTAVSNKPSIMAAQYRLEGSEKSIRIAQSGYYPDLSFSAGISSGYFTVDGVSEFGFFDQLDKNQNKSLGFSLSIPIFNRFATRNRVRAAKMQRENLSIQLDNAKKVLYKEIQQAWYNALAAETKFKSSGTAVEANEESFRLMREKFENGKSTSIEYNEAKLNLMKALSDRIQAKYDYMFRTKVLDFYKGIPIE
ncbi:TolC family protein [Bacteroides sp. 214]|uniref:TolC family protein n=1 Tax=Bacteroides sp. 214 TaxID=2302935 RepID=UPI0013D7EBB5|nr:TolC family protein [Bacteroides sp. 214]NDW13127.1 TolC family protein [Bacteroides sp. 214]